MSAFKDEFSVLHDLYNSEALPKLWKLKAISAKRPIILYGAGGTGDLVADLYSELGIRVECFCDTYAKGIHKSGLPIISPDEMKSQFGDCLIVITAVAFYDAVHNYLRSLDFPNEQIIGTPALYPYETIAHHMDGYEWAYDFFDDAASKAIIMQLLESFLLATPCPYSSPSEMYFERTIVKFSDKEIFADCGAFTGDTIEGFVKRTNGYRRIYAFEPDHENAKAIEENLSAYEDISIIRKGVWREEAELRFSAGNSNASRFEDGGSAIIPVTTLDETFAGAPISEYPTFIKMDIEGAEREALLGGRHVIGSARPKMAVCVYHKLEDVYKLTQLIHSFCPEYKFALRQYRASVFDTVLYAT